jgi:hypothetical protein
MHFLSQVDPAQGEARTPFGSEEDCFLEVIESDVLAEVGYGAASG